MNNNLTHEARQREDGAARQCRVVSTGALWACETQIAFILDRSGSMDTIAKEAIGGFNALIEKLFKHQREACCLSHVEQSSLRGEFLFLGADLESVEYAKTLNVDSQYAQQFECNGEGVQEAMSYSSVHISERRRIQNSPN